MGTSTNGILAYGYNLGGDEGWELKGCEGYGEFRAPWYVEPDDEDERPDIAELIKQRLLTEVAGFTEEWESGVTDYWDRQREAEARLGVELVSYCSGEYPMYVLAAHEITVYRGDVKEIDLASMATSIPEWDAKLAAAVAALGIEPKQERPAWLLCSYWG